MSAGWILLYLGGLYVLAGLAVAAAFVLRGVTRTIEHPATVSPGARALLFPAAVAFWPLVLRRWMQAKARP